MYARITPAPGRAIIKVVKTRRNEALGPTPSYSDRKPPFRSGLAPVWRRTWTRLNTHNDTLKQEQRRKHKRPQRATFLNKESAVSRNGDGAQLERSLP